MKYNGTLAHKMNHDFDNNVRISNVSNTYKVSSKDLSNVHTVPSKSLYLTSCVRSKTSKKKRLFFSTKKSYQARAFYYNTIGSSRTPAN